jgi:hypothetical protein
MRRNIKDDPEDNELRVPVFERRCPEHESPLVQNENPEHRP